MVKVGVNGALGKMGRRILALAYQDTASFSVVGAFDRAGLEDVKIGSDIGLLLGHSKPMGIKVTSLDSARETALSACDALIDFTGPEGAKLALAAALLHKKGLVIGSTGLGAELEDGIRAASGSIAIVYSSNMSVGVNLVLDLVGIASKKAPADFDIEITEAHHRHKKDAPSGTALMLAKAVAVAKGWDLKTVLRFRSEEKVDKDRSSDEIGMQVIRAGEIVGDHTVLFAGPAETIEITHRAHSRDTFARGALRAAQFVVKAKPGLYSMREVLQ